MQLILRFILFVTFSMFSFTVYSQTNTCLFCFDKHKIESHYLDQEREFWVSLPLNYSDSIEYNVMYVLDAEWRFNLVRNIEFDYSANEKINKHIIVGIPHINWRSQRGIDLSFSQSRIEYDGEEVDSVTYNETNSGGANNFYNYLISELIPSVDTLYSTNGNNTLIGHSMGGYFGGYILSMDHPFSTIHMYDPSIWYNNGEVIDVISNGIPKKDSVKVFITYQPIPTFHKEKIETLIKELKTKSNLLLTSNFYEFETHNGLFLPSFVKGLEILKNDLESVKKN